MGNRIGRPPRNEESEMDITITDDTDRAEVEVELA
jgi:hypothetical protein